LGWYYAEQFSRISVRRPGNCEGVRFMSSCLCLAALGWVVGAPALKGPAPPALVGHWECTSLTVNGKAGPPDKCVWEFAPHGKLYRRYGDPPPVEHRYTTDPAKAPAHLDFTDRGGEDTIEAIYKVEGDTLTLCFSNLTGDDRPSRFESPAKSKLRLLTFRRVRPKE
jgi:uncharacterized protein (TIGR03067 family)